MTAALKEYMLILRDEDAKFERFSPDEMQKTIDRFNAWNADLRAKGAMVGAARLSTDGGKTMRGGNTGTPSIDGPFSEAKEAIGGYYLVRAADEDAALTLADGCPILSYGGSVEVREVMMTIGEEYVPD